MTTARRTDRRSQRSLTGPCAGPHRRISTACLLATVGCALWPAAGSGETPEKTLRVPQDIGEELLKPRRDAQLATQKDLEAFSFFLFTDRRKESGIGFVHRVVDDAARDYKMVHYDHGNGLAAADVDGDGHHDLYFVNQVGANGLWKNLGGGRFKDVTASAGVGVDDRISVTASFADVDNDGDPDLFVTTVKMGNLLFENDGSGRFRDITRHAGVGHVGHSSGATFFDYDRDGRLDLFVTNVGQYTTAKQGRADYYVGVDSAFSGHLFPERFETSILYRNLGGNRFADVSKETGLVDSSWSGDSTLTDFDLDGWPDLYLTNMQGDDHYWQNVEGRFVERTAEYFPKTPWGAMGVRFFDYNNDGAFDMIVTDMHSDMVESIGPEKEKLKSTEAMLEGWPDEALGGGGDNIFGNAFYEGRADGTFVEISDRVGAENYWPWGVSTGDLNADGWEDVFITASMNYQFRYAVNSLLLNVRGQRFHDSEFILGVEPRRGSLVAPWFVLDCDGADQEHEHCADKTGKLQVLGALGSRASVLFDLDDDGDLDIVTGEFNSPPQVLISDLSEQLEIHYLEIRLEGRRSNRDGLGARVEVRVGDRRLTQLHDGKSGYLSQSSLPLYFGLGEAKEADSVEVSWPSGTRQAVAGPLAAGQTLVIREPRGDETKESQ